ncbi:type II CAAX endopeptidase family protein [Halalkalicoccus tibetensis]|uniref:Type II CAAX endopeptidase family protein n=1 Tax=Halalkalicoccus tibetensis TaxID=175632 RepID=A0ABD5V759_9EURY
MVLSPWNHDRSRNDDLVPDGGKADDANDEGRNAEEGDDRVGLVWRLAAVFAGVTAIWLLIFVMSDAVFEPGYSRPGHVTSAVLATVLTVPLVVLARRRLDKRPLAGLGLTPLRTAWHSFLLGIGCYLLPAGAGLGAALAFGWVELSLNTSVGNLVFLLLSLAVLVFLYEALPEELAFRGYFYRNLSASFSRWLAVGGQAVLFCLWAVVIGAAPAPERLLIFFFMAIVIGAIRVITGDLWACIGFHLAFQTVQQFFAGGWANQPFVVSDPVILVNIVFGLVPLALAVLVLRLVVNEDVEWRSSEPDPA